MGSLREALKTAIFVALKTVPDLQNHLMLEQRWGLVAVLCAVAFGGSLLRSFLKMRPAPAAKPGRFAADPNLRKIIGRVGLALVIAYPFIAVALAGSSGSIKWIENFGVQILLYILLAWGLNIVVGLAGLLDLGYVAFYAVGAYSSALLTKTFDLSFWVTLPIAGVLAALWGLIIGLPVLRLRGDYLAIVTLAFAEIVRIVIINWVPVTGGYAGISNIPKPSLFGFSFTAGPDNIATALGLPPSPLYRIFFLFYLALALALFAYWVTARLRKLPVGRAWEAMREDEIACRSLGINTVTSKLSAFASGAFFGGLAGAFFAAQQGFISPRSFEFSESAFILAIVVLGGMGSQIGIAIAATAMIIATELLRELSFLKAVFGPDFEATQYRMMLFGLALVLLMVWRPKGLVTAREPSVRLDTARPAAVPQAAGE
jgi:branched-chain amino acid transport system permease protein